MVAQTLLSPPTLDVDPAYHERSLPLTAQYSENRTGQSIPVVDLAPLLGESPSMEKRKKVIEQIAAAAQTWGFFQVINHGLSLELLENAFAVSKEFFSLPLEQKIKSRLERGAAPVTTGFVNDDYADGKLKPRERVLFFSEGSPAEENSNSFSEYNIWPEKPRHLRQVIEQLIKEEEKTALSIMGLVSEGLGLPSSLLHENYMQKTNVLTMFCYPPSPDQSALGSPPHKDGNVLTLLAQDEVGGLQVFKDDQWVTVEPIKGAFIVNIGDILQVWTNDKYKSTEHRVTNNRERARYSFGFFCAPGMQVQVEPLPQFTSDMGVAPRYRTFQYQEYLLNRFKNLSKDVKTVGVDMYAI